VQADPAGGNNKVEAEVPTTKANAWETLTFDFATQVRHPAGEYVVEA
jgi:hypothetical protein